jgi:hypothetical protein
MFRTVARPEPVDRLRVVPHHREPGAFRAQPVQELGLQRVCVLVLVDQHVVELRADGRPRGVGSHERVEEEEQVVVVQDPLLGLAVHVGTKEQLQPVDLLGAPGESSSEHRVQRAPGVHAATVDVEAGRLAREASLSPAQLELCPEHLEQILGIAAVVDGEAGMEADPVSVLPEEPGGDRMERPAPHPRGRRPVRARAAEQPVHRRSSSAAARRAKVRRRMRSAGTPREMSCATRWASVVVFPVPAPATTRSGPSP